MQPNAPATPPQLQQEAVDHGLVRGPLSWWGADAQVEADAGASGDDPARQAALQGLLRPDPHH